MERMKLTTMPPIMMTDRRSTIHALHHTCRQQQGEGKTRRQLRGFVAQRPPAGVPHDGTATADVGVDEDVQHESHSRAVDDAPAGAEGLTDKRMETGPRFEVQGSPQATPDP